MKKLFVLAGLCAALHTSAQYSQWTYTAGPGFVRASNGHIANVAAPGHVMAGPNSGGPNAAYVVRNDLNGNSNPTPAFNNSYMLSSATGGLEVQECKVTEIGIGYALAGVCYDPSSSLYSVFYQTLDHVGTPSIMPITYYPGINALADIAFGNIYASPYGEWLYIVGSVKTFDLDRWRPFIMKIDYSGTLIWSHIYDDLNTPTVDWKGLDIAENNSGTVAVSGTFENTSIDGCCFFVDARFGNFSLPVWLYGTNSSVDELYSIIYSNTTGGWLVCGTSNTAGTEDAWMMNLDPSGYVNWSILGNKSGENTQNQARQIIERYNASSGVYEFYTVGSVEGSTMGGYDVQVFKGDVGAGTLSDQFAYGGSSDDYGFGIAANDNSPGQGLAIFGSSESFPVGLPSTYFIKADFNGVSGCNEYLTSADYIPGPVMISGRDYVIIDYMMPFGNNNIGLQTGNENMLCYTEGSGLQAQVKDAGLFTRDKQMVTVSPNPVSAASNIQLNITAPAGTVEVIVADYMGREYINQRFDIREGGEQTLAIELGKANLAPGIYLLKVNGLDKPATQVLVIK